MDEKENNNNEQQTQQIAIIESIVKRNMTGDAISRYGNVKIAHPEIALRALPFLLQLVQQGTRIDDGMLKNILKNIQK